MIYDEQIVNTVSLCAACVNEFLCSEKYHSIVTGMFCGAQKINLSFIHSFNPFTVIWGSSPNLKKPLMLQKVILMLFHSHVVDYMWKQSSIINRQHIIFVLFSTHLLLIYPILVLWVWHDKVSVEFVQTALRSKPQTLVTRGLFLSAGIEAEGWMWPEETRISRKSSTCKWITDINSCFI